MVDIQPIIAGNVHNFVSGVKASDMNEIAQHAIALAEPTHWKAIWDDRRGHQERLYNKIGMAKSQRIKLAKFGIIVEVVPCLLVELDAI